MKCIPALSYTKLLGLLLLACTSQTLGRQARAADEFQPLFNGSDFSGWVRTNTPAETWSYQDGLLVCSGAPIGEIRTEKMYQNFILELEWRHMVPRGNAGVFVWADDITSRGVPFHRGIEVQVLENAYGNNESHTTHCDIFPIHGATMTPLNGRNKGSRAFPTENRSLPSPQWNSYRIECRDGQVSLAVNGKVVTRGTDCVPRKGYICLESEGGVVHYRNVRIQELPASDIASELVAIADRGYVSLYNGLNLNEWKAQSSTSAKWKSNDWVLAFQGDENESSELLSLHAPPITGLVVDVRLKSATSGAAIQLGSGLRINLADPQVSKLLQSPGSWNRIELRRSVDGLQALINGEQADVPGLSGLAELGPIKLMPIGAVDFCNVYGKPAAGRN